MATLQVDGLASMEITATKARSLFANAYLKVHILLGERNFAARGSLEGFDRMEFFLLVRRRDCISPKSRFYSLGACTAIL